MHSNLLAGAAARPAARRRDLLGNGLIEPKLRGLQDRQAQEDFLVLMGECILIIEDQERHLGPWDFVHCPAGAAHAFVGAGDGPCILLCAGNRDLNDETFSRVYKRSGVALRYGASVEQDTSSGAEANAPFRDHWRVERPECWRELPWSSGS